VVLSDLPKRTIRKYALIVAAPAAALIATASIAQMPSEDAARALYVSTCSGCHAAGGEGGYGPPLTNNEFVELPENMIGQMFHPRELMPNFSSLSDEDVATLVNFVRTVFNDYTDLIDADFVAAQR
jgi:mono/diheme cytochrome c family protein